MQHIVSSLKDNADVWCLCLCTFHGFSLLNTLSIPMISFEFMMGIPLTVEQV